jgi:hypothetical protein
MKQHPKYTHLFVARDGRILSTKSGKILRTQVNQKGYEVFCTRLDGREGKSTLLRVHRLVAETYVYNPENKLFVNHKDGDKLNNHYANLEWVTNKENVRHAFATGLATGRLGAYNPAAVLTDQQAQDIRLEYKQHSRDRGCRALGRKYGVGHQVISRVVRGESYAKIGTAPQVSEAL